MHTVKLNIGDNIYTHIMFLLKSLNLNDLEIIEEHKVTNNPNTKQKIKKIFKTKKIKLFADIEDPLKWQDKQREEW